MIIDGYGDVPFEVGDVLLDGGDGLCVFTHPHYSHCGFWYFTTLSGYYTSRTETLEHFEKVGHVDERAVAMLRYSHGKE